MRSTGARERTKRAEESYADFATGQTRSCDRACFVLTLRGRSKLRSLAEKLDHAGLGPPGGAGWIVVAQIYRQYRMRIFQGAGRGIGGIEFDRLEALAKTALVGCEALVRNERGADSIR